MNRLALVLAAAALAGCAATTPSLHSAWYLQYKAGQTSGDSQLYVALLNRSSRVLMVEKIILNPGGKDPAGGWEREKKFPLEPGRLVVIPSSDFKRGAKAEEFTGGCRLPVVVLVVVDKDSLPWPERMVGWVEGDPEHSIRAELVGRMPSSLAAGWETCTSPDQ